MLSVVDRDWFRSSSWDADIAERFEARLRRARAANRAQYVRIQASHLLESPDASTREAGRALLRRVINDHPDDELETKFACEQLGDSLAREGRLDEAEGALRETLRRIQASPTGASGTSGTTELRLAEVLIARGDATSIDDAGQLLAAVESEVRIQAALMRDVLYRFFLACARVAYAQRAPEAAAELARAALHVADDISTPIPRHPTVGWPHATDGERAELRSISSAP
jgi:hypothetical protein